MTEIMKGKGSDNMFLLSAGALTTGDYLTMQGATMFASAFILIFALIIKRSILGKIIIAICCYGLITSTVNFLSAKYNISGDIILLCVIAVIVIFYALKHKRKKNKKKGEYIYYEKK